MVGQMIVLEPIASRLLQRWGGKVNLHADSNPAGGCECIITKKEIPEIDSISES